MPDLDLGDARLHYRDEGDPDGAPVVFAHALGADLRLWDRLFPVLPPTLRLIRYDLRGHGQSSTPAAPYAMGTLVRDAERLIEALSLRDTVFVGCSIGGMVAQGLAVKRLDLVRALVLCNTATKIATPEIWQARVAEARAQGMAALSDATMRRWFPLPFRDGPEGRLWRERFATGRVEGYAGGAAAIAGTDFYTTTATLTLPTLVIAGSDDGSTPADLVRETAALIRGTRFQLIRRAGHVPMVDRPAEVAATLGAFLEGIGHG